MFLGWHTNAFLSIVLRCPEIKRCTVGWAHFWDPWMFLNVTCTLSHGFLLWSLRHIRYFMNMRQQNTGSIIVPSCPSIRFIIIILWNSNNNSFHDASFCVIKYASSMFDGVSPQRVNVCRLIAQQNVFRLKLLYRNRSIGASSFALQFTLQRFASPKLNCVWHTINKLWIRLIYYWVYIFYHNGYIVNYSGVLRSSIHINRFVYCIRWRDRLAFIIFYPKRVNIVIKDDVMFICHTFREYCYCLPDVTFFNFVQVRVKNSYV